MTSRVRKIGSDVKTYLLYDLFSSFFGLEASSPYRILVGTHHKTGTVWLISIFNRICRQAGLVYYSGEQSALPEQYDVFFQNHSRFDLAELKDEYRGLHMIRDPRDVLVSGCFYHQRSVEPWLHVKRDDFGGLTYQEKINSYNHIEDKLLFEMDQVARDCYLEMERWDYENPAFVEVRYEDVIADKELRLFGEIFCHLGFDNSSMADLLEIAYDSSLFSGNVRKSTMCARAKPDNGKPISRR